MVNNFRLLFLILPFYALQPVSAQQKLAAGNGHGHNDYQQQIPLLTAYYAGMGAIEADVFLRNGILFVAHETAEIKTERTLKNMYLDPLATFYKENGNKGYPDSAKKLQLVIDIKEVDENVLQHLVKELKGYGSIFDPQKNPAAIRVVVTGELPLPSNFAKYASLISFDGRPGIAYSKEQLQHIAMISADIVNYSVWNGKGTPTPDDLQKMTAVVSQAHALGKPFRFWGTKDNPNTWKELEHMGVDWIGTDQPTVLKDFYQNRAKLEYINPSAYQPYQPSYETDGLKKKVKNVILLIGDGMGLAQIQAGLSSNFGQSNIINMKYVGLSRTEAVNSDFTDSAAGATAMATGKKTNNRYIGMDAEGRALVSIPDTLAPFGIKSGVISTGDITDATPAAFYAHETERSMSKEIAADFLNSSVAILVGSGRKAFTENENKQLLSQIEKRGYSYKTNLNDFVSSNTLKQIVLLDDSATRKTMDGRGEMLKTSLLKTIELLSKNKKGFFVMAEGAKIDHGGHANNLPFLITEQHDFDRTVGAVLEFADKDGETLVIVTADHETGGLSLLDASYKKGMVRGHFSSDDHTNIMVPVFAYGPGALDFIGVYPNTEIFAKIIKAFRLN